MLNRETDDQIVKVEEPLLDEEEEQTGNNKWSKAAFVVDNLTVLWSDLVDDSLGQAKQLSRDLTTTRFSKRHAQETTLDKELEDDLDDNFEVTDADIERACRQHIDRETICKKAEKKKQTLLADCYIDPLFETSKSVYDKTSAASLLLHNCQMQAPGDMLKFVPTLDG